jgi:choline dehydrogenase-like flavoprotein
VVESVLFDPVRGRASGVRVVDGLTGQAIDFRAKLVFLCASALESVRILLNSRSARFPSGRNVTEKTDRFLRGYGFQGGAFRERWERGVALRGFGAELKRTLREDGPWRMVLYGFGECLPRSDNRVEIDPEVKDRWGIPALRINVSWGDNERAMLKDMTETAVEILQSAGAQDVTPFLEDNPPGLTIHEMGGARMGRDPRTSVLNGWSQAHDVPNLLVTDGAGMTSSACQNPSLTYMALTARACDHAVRELGAGRL